MANRLNTLLVLLLVCSLSLPSNSTSLTKKISNMSHLKTTKHRTKWRGNCNGDVECLIFHQIKCSKNEAISQFVMEKKGNYIRYNYRCTKSHEITDDCEEYNTERQYPKYPYNKLDKHEMNCPDNWVIQSFGFRIASLFSYNYKYTCCKNINTDVCYEFNHYPIKNGNLWKTDGFDREIVWAITDAGFNRIKLIQAKGNKNPTYQYKTRHCYIYDHSK